MLPNTPVAIATESLGQVQTPQRDVLCTVSESASGSGGVTQPSKAIEECDQVGFLLHSEAYVEPLVIKGDNIAQTVG